MVRVPVPDGISAGVLDLRSYGAGLVAVETGDDGRTAELPSGAADRIRRDWREAGYDVADEPDDSGTCSVELTGGGICGRDLPCQYHGMEGA